MKKEILDAVEILATAIVRLSKRKKLCVTEPETKVKKRTGRKKHSEKLTHKRREITHVIK